MIKIIAEIAQAHDGSLGILTQLYRCAGKNWRGCHKVPDAHR